MHFGNQMARSPMTENSFNDIMSQADKHLTVAIRNIELPLTSRVCSTAMENPKGINFKTE
jgi:hypothetical protein